MKFLETLRLNVFRRLGVSNDFLLPKLHHHLQVRGVDKGGISAGQEGDGGRHLGHLPQAAADVEAAPHWLPLGPLALGCLYRQETNYVRTVLQRIFEDVVSKSNMSSS
jgi:hypothetical protein